jgi:hypothetical protein
MFFLKIHFLFGSVAEQRELSGECLQKHGGNVEDTGGLAPYRLNFCAIGRQHSDVVFNDSLSL